MLNAGIIRKTEIQKNYNDSKRQPKQKGYRRHGEYNKKKPDYNAICK